VIAVVEIELTDYRIPVMRKLQERLGEPIVVYHGVPAPGSNLNVVKPGQEVGFAHQRLAQRWLFGGRLLFNNPLPVLRGERPRAVIVRHTVRSPMFIPMLVALRALHIPVIGWGHGYSQRRAFRPGRHLADRMHLAVVRWCDAYVCYAARNREVLASYVSSDRLFVARNTVDTDRLFELRRKFDSQSRTQLRRELALDADLPYLCFIGRLQSRKRPDVLLDAARLLKEEHGRRVGLLFVGAGPMHDELERRAGELQLTDVVFTGAQYAEAAARYLYVADAMAMPGALGLAAAHSLALGVPVVTQRLGSDLVGHGPEAAYVRDGINGRIADPGGAREFAAAVEDVLSSQPDYASAAIEFAESHLGLDRMVDGFVRAIARATE